MSALGERLIAWERMVSGDISADFWDDILKDELSDHDPAGNPRRTTEGSLPLGELLWMVAGEVRSRRQHLEGLEAAISRARAIDITENGAVTFGEVYITVAPAKTKTLIDRGALIAWATHHGDADAVQKLWRLDAKNLRITTLRGMAERVWRRDTGVPETMILTETEEAALADYIKATEETFVETTEGDARLSEMPISKAPAWVQKVAEHGHRIGSFKNRAKT